MKINEIDTITHTDTSKLSLGIYIVFSCAMFFFFIAIGYWTAQADSAVGDQIYNMFQDVVVTGIASDSAAAMSFQIFINNVQICALIFLGGATFGLFTLFLLMTNGIVIGVLIEVLLRDMSASVLMVGLLPHGIFEIPAVLVSAALGMIIARGLWGELSGKGDALDSAKYAGRLFILYVVPFIFVAACVEGFITPFVMEMMVTK
ncbi:MAG: stage II sporulation protein M [Methanomicrobiales archaeon]|jgi:stage II sporulation protein M|nr:stage II sporulation protein M [Methanomicrobiales archaeon]